MKAFAVAPVWGRGLKPGTEACAQRHRRRPRVGAWIETLEYLV